MLCCVCPMITSFLLLVWLNDVYQGEIKAGKTTAYTVAPGTYDLYAEEASGFFPDVWELTATILQCDIKTVTIQN